MCDDPACPSPHPPPPGEAWCPTRLGVELVRYLLAWPTMKAGPPTPVTIPQEHPVNTPNNNSLPECDCPNSVPLGYHLEQCARFIPLSTDVYFDHRLDVLITDVARHLQTDPDTARLHLIHTLAGSLIRPRPSASSSASTTASSDGHTDPSFECVPPPPPSSRRDALKGRGRDLGHSASTTSSETH